MTRSWIISDTHYGHVNIPKYEPMRLAWGRDWAEMTETMLRAWIACVAPGDTVYHVGDFAMGPAEQMKTYRDRLPGNIILIKGNHDRKNPSWLIPGRDTYHPVRLEFTDSVHGRLILRHDPKDFTEEEARRADLLVHGHIHSNAYPSSLSDFARNKCVNLSVETLPNCPAPMPWSELGNKNRGGPVWDGPRHD